MRLETFLWILWNQHAREVNDALVPSRVQIRAAASQRNLLVLAAHLKPHPDRRVDPPVESGELVKRESFDDGDLAGQYEKAVAKARLWSEMATKAEQDGRTIDAQRCKDKALDWSSRARQLAGRQESATKS